MTQDTLTPEERAARIAKAALPNTWLYVVRITDILKPDDTGSKTAYELRGTWTPETGMISTGLWRTELEAWESHKHALELQQEVKWRRA